ncbi:Oxysterol-binding protein [Meloidogyne graminicola]|uniref:Oxysterol-binding protein n=1 Tax=Meloidogyne graminicola TaxID=189291 RepID=A0A8S9ZR16_9BILA|nr:Oxysterol-binding protein [Meloidogyne graminicola]
MPKRGSSFYLPSTKMSSNSTNQNNNAKNNSSQNEIDYSGWLSKWTNYVKGYRRRWFIIDSMGNLKYYRNPNDVNGPSRGSIKLEEASISSDQQDGLNMVIHVPFSNSLHLRALNDLERSKWLKALEDAKHKAIKRSSAIEDDENETEKILNKTLELKENSLGDLDEITNEFNKISAKFSNELEGFIHFSVGHLNVTDAKKCQSKANSLKILRENTLKLTNQLLIKYKKEYSSICRLVNSQNEKLLELQRQYEILARQHSQLEGEALRLSARVADESSTFMTALGPPKNEEITEDNEEQFLDATDILENKKEDFEEENGGCGINGGGGGGWSEKSSSFCFDEEENNIEIFRGNNNNNLKENNNSFTNLLENNLLDLSKCKIQINVSKIFFFLTIFRRTTIPPKPDSFGLNLWSIMKNCIGKELTKIPIPVKVNFNEPLSMLQRITEDLEYSYLLDRASEKLNICERLAYTATFAITCYSSTAKRTTKPFNPLLGETFEFDRRADLGWRSLAEQVSHHPPAAAMHTEGVNWELNQEFMVASRFRGKYMSVIPTDGKADFTFQKVTTTVHNIIVGKLWIDNHGVMNIINHISGERAIIKFHSYSYFSSDRPRKVEGLILDKKGNAHFYIFGYWDSHINIAKIINQKTQQGGKVFIEADEQKEFGLRKNIFCVLVWFSGFVLGDASMFNFTKLAIEMNEPEEGIAPTDSRFRPDQRLMENGYWDKANEKKNELENKQRKARREAENEAENSIKNSSLIHKIRGNEYWKCKETKNWLKCPNIY